VKNPKQRLVKLKKGQKVRDVWFKEWGVGVCTKALKTVWTIHFSDGVTRKFDKPHLQFLEAI